MSQRLLLPLLVLAVACTGGDLLFAETASSLGTRPPTLPVPPKAPGPFPAPIAPPAAAETDSMPSETTVSSRGDLVHHLPLKAPRGRAGVEPSLALRYSSSGNNGILGVGFTLEGTSEIRRCHKTFATDGRADGIDFDATDVYCLDGERMIALGPWAGAPNSIEYRTHEDRIARIVGYGSAASHTSFRVWLKNGKIRRYETILEAHRVVANGVNVSDAGVVASAWLLSTEEDRSGNFMTFVWNHSASPNWPFGAESTLDRIEYTARNGEPAQRRVEFHYEARPDPVIIWEAGARRELEQRLAAVEFYAPNPINIERVWGYSIEYHQSPATGRSRVSSIQRCGEKGCDRARSFAWEARTTMPIDVSSFTMTRRLENWLVYDANGDGRDDVLYDQNYHLAGEAIPVMLRFGQPTGAVKPLGSEHDVTPFDPITFSQSFYVGSARPLDLDGDGRIGLTARTDAPSCTTMKLHWNAALNNYEFATTPCPLGWTSPEYIDADGDGRLDRFFRDKNNAELWAIDTWQSPPVDTGAGSVLCARGIDLDGDGRGELLAGTDINCSSSVVIGLDDNDQPIVGSTIGMNKSSSGVTFADLNGDGLAEALWLRDPPTFQWNTGNGFSFELDLDPWLATQLAGLGPDHFYMRATDLDGDRRQDLLFFRTVAPETTYALFSRGDGTFAHIDLGLNPGDNARVGDFDGDGRPDIAVADDHDLLVALQTPGDELDVVVEIEDEPNGLRPLAAIGYGRTNTNSAPAASCEYPQICLRYGMRTVQWIWGAEFPAIRHFRFEDPRFDLTGGAFLGFGRVREWIPARPQEITTEYDHATLNRQVYALAHHPAKVTTITPVLESGPGGPTQQLGTVNARIKEEATTYEVRWSNHRRTYFVRPSLVVTREWEEQVDISWAADADDHVTGVDGGPIARQHTLQRVWDDFANEVSSNTLTIGGDRSQIVRTHDNLVDPWLIGLIRSEENSSGRANLPLPSARRKELDYDSRGRLTQTRTEPQNIDPTVRQTVTLTIDQDGNLRMMTASAPNALDHVLRYEYTDLSGERIFNSQTWNDLGHSTWFNYHPAFGTELSSMDANGVVTESHLDDLGRVIWRKRSGGAAVSTTYEAIWGGALNLGTRVTETKSSGEAKIIDRDDRNLITAERDRAFDGGWIVKEKDYDAFDRLVEESRPGLGGPGAIRTIVYNSLDQKLRVHEPNGAVASWQYPAFGMMISIDAEGRQRNFYNDLEDRLIQSVAFDGNTPIETNYIFGKYGQLEQIIDEKNNVITFGYDARGRKTSMIDPDLGPTTTVFNGHGEIQSTTNAAGQTTTYLRDPLGRPTNIITLDGTTTMTWDTAPHGLGSLASSLSADNIQDQRYYDSFGRLERKVRTIGAESFELEFGYDQHGRVETINYPEVPTRNHRFTLRRYYGVAGDLAEVGEVVPLGNGQEMFRSIWSVAARNEDRSLVAAVYGNSLNETRGYDPATGRLDNVLAIDGAQLYSLGYGRDLTGKVTSRVDAVNGRTETFDYDDLHRLTLWSLEHGGETRTTTYEYDAIGNLEHVYADGILAETHTYGANAGPHAITGGSFGVNSYDARGRLESDVSGTFEWTAFDLPKKRTTALGTTSFAYDSEGRRALKIAGSRETLSFDDLYERRKDASGVVHVFHISGAEGVVAEVLHQAGNEHTFYLTGDDLGSIGVITRDGAGPADYLYFAPFGQRIDAGGGPIFPAPGDVRFGFTGHQHDDELEWIDMTGRIYSPRLRRFLTPDPMIAAPKFGQALNRYSYVMNDPLNLIDPSGYKAIEGECPEDGGCGTLGSDGTAEGTGADQQSESSEGGEMSSDQSENMCSYDSAAAASFSEAGPTQLSASSPVDAMEREADAVADRVISANDSAVESADSGAGSSSAAGASDGEGERTPEKSNGAQPSSGHIEQRFQGSELGAVRLGTSPSAAQLSNDIMLQAYRVGTSEAFNSGVRSSAGRDLIAHETAHVMQQTGSAPQGK